MALSDCEKCWDTPCTCGHAWRRATVVSRLRHASSVLGVPFTVLRDRLADVIPEQHPGSLSIKFTEGTIEHRCGLQGFDPWKGDVCPACPVHCPECGSTKHAAAQCDNMG